MVHLLEFDGLALLQKNHRTVFSVFRVFRKFDPVERFAAGGVLHLETCCVKNLRPGHLVSLEKGRCITIISTSL